MGNPYLVGIYITGAKSAPMTAVEEARAISGQGLEGDRYFQGAGTFSGKSGHEPDREVTLIELEALEALHRDYQIELEPRSTRRNLITRGVPLNH
ncbi:MAG TPA: hypothetical protein VGZ22_23500, partial [Isosphaeraceae bacterium]|nr:hypothetical protein [Isosphaeraceae bacterium]